MLILLYFTIFLLCFTTFTEILQYFNTFHSVSTYVETKYHYSWEVDTISFIPECPICVTPTSFSFRHYLSVCYHIDIRLYVKIYCN